MKISSKAKRRFRTSALCLSFLLHHTLFPLLVNSQVKANNIKQVELACDFISFMILEDNTCIDLTSVSEGGRSHDWVEVYRDSASSFFILPLSIRRVNGNMFSVRVREVFEDVQESQIKRADSTYSIDCESATVQTGSFSYTDASGNPFNDDQEFGRIINDLEEGNFDENSLRVMLAISSLEFQSEFPEELFIAEGSHVNEVREYICSTN